MKISIIIPVYNVEPYISRCIDSVLEQTYKDIEVIVVDDCSPDNSIETARNIVSKHINKDKVIFTKHQTNKGLSAARNTGINLASGKYIYFLDSDDELPLNAIESLVDIANLHNPDFVYGSLIVTGTTQTFPNLIADSTLIGESILENHFLNQWYVMGCNKLLNRDFVINHNLFFIENILHEDITWSFNLAMAAKKMAICKNTTYIYHIRENSITKTVKEKNITDLIFSLNYIVNSLKESSITYRNSNALHYIMTLKMLILDISIYQEFDRWKKTYLMFRNIDLEEIRNNKMVLREKKNSTKIKYYLLYHTPPRIVSILIRWKKNFNCFF